MAGMSGIFLHYEKCESICLLSYVFCCGKALDSFRKCRCGNGPQFLYLQNGDVGLADKR